MELTANLNNNMDINSNINLSNQKNFLESSLGKVVNTALNVGIRALLPDLIEDQVINIKDEIINNGFQAGVKEAISSAIELGKSTIGIFTGKFDNVTQARNACKNGGIIDGISKALDYGLNMSSKIGKIPNSIITILKNGKNTILNTISNNIENEFNKQITSVEKIDKYMQNWKESYNNKDFSDMEKQYKKLKKEIKNIIPLENTIKNARNIENLHILIKNKGGNFELTKEETELAKKLIN